jgi:hypothetical protein
VSRARIIGLVAALGVIGGFALWRSRVANEAETTAAALRSADEAMQQLNRSNADLKDRLTRAGSKVISAAILDTAAAGPALGAYTSVIDEHLALLDRAVSLADAYLEREPDDAVRSNIAKIRQQGVKVRKMRDELRALQDRVTKGGVTADELASSMASIGFAMLLP